MVMSPDKFRLKVKALIASDLDNEELPPFGNCTVKEE